MTGPEAPSQLIKGLGWKSMLSKFVLFPRPNGV